MLSKVISVSEKVNTLPDIFDMLLFTWMIPHADDYGRLPGSPAKVKALIVPMSERSINQVKESIQRLSDQKLIIWYESDGEKAIQIIDFEKHQQGLKGKKASKYSSPHCYSPLNNSHLTSYNNSLSASESDIEELVATMLINNEFIDDEEFVSVERQYRIENSYIDIIATGKNNGRYLFEIKRQRLSNAAIDQIIKYRSMVNDPGLICTLVGYGLSTNFDSERCRDEKINVLIYDDALSVVISQSFNVNYRYPMLLSNRTELNRTEQNGIEEEGKGTGSADSLPLDSNPHKDSILKLIKECNVEKCDLYSLDLIYSFIGAVDIEVIEAAIKKSSDKHINYAINTLNNWLAEGKTTLQQINPTPKVRPFKGKSEKPNIPIVQSCNDVNDVSDEEFAEMLALAEKMKEESEEREHGKKETA